MSLAKNPSQIVMYAFGGLSATIFVALIVMVLAGAISYSKRKHPDGIHSPLKNQERTDFSRPSAAATRLSAAATATTPLLTRSEPVPTMGTARTVAGSVQGPPAGSVPAGLAPAGLAPAGLAPAGLAPAGSVQGPPAGLAPAGLAPAGSVQGPPAGSAPAGSPESEVEPSGPPASIVASTAPPPPPIAPILDTLEKQAQAVENNARAKYDALAKDLAALADANLSDKDEKTLGDIIEALQKIDAKKQNLDPLIQTLTRLKTQYLDKELTLKNLREAIQQDQHVQASHILAAQNVLRKISETDGTPENVMQAIVNDVVIAENELNMLQMQKQRSEDTHKNLTLPVDSNVKIAQNIYAKIVIFSHILDRDPPPKAVHIFKSIRKQDTKTVLQSIEDLRKQLGLLRIELQTDQTDQKDEGQVFVNYFKQNDEKQNELDLKLKGLYNISLFNDPAAQSEIKSLEDLATKLGQFLFNVDVIDSEHQKGRFGDFVYVKDPAFIQQFEKDTENFERVKEEFAPSPAPTPAASAQPAAPAKAPPQLIKAALYLNLNTVKYYWNKQKELQKNEKEYYKVVEDNGTLEPFKKRFIQKVVNAQWEALPQAQKTLHNLVETIWRLPLNFKIRVFEPRSPVPSKPVASAGMKGGFFKVSPQEGGAPPQTKPLPPGLLTDWMTLGLLKGIRIAYYRYLLHRRRGGTTRPGASGIEAQDIILDFIVSMLALMILSNTSINLALPMTDVMMSCIALWGYTLYLDKKTHAESLPHPSINDPTFVSTVLLLLPYFFVAYLK